jgi:hypothetical protein
MSNEQWDEWGLSSGLPLADADVEITAVEFGFNNDIAAGATFANITFRDLDSGDEIEQSFSVGDGFIAADRDGSQLTTKDGRPRKLSKNSNYGRLIQSAIEALGGVEELAKLGPGFRFASTWVGTKWHTGTVEVEVSAPGSTEKKKRDRIIFTQYLGRDGAAPAAAPAAAEGKAAGNGVDPELWAKLIEFAKEAKDHEAFMDVALELDGVKGVKAVEKLVMGTKAGTVWAESR